MIAKLALFFQSLFPLNRSFEIYTDGSHKGKWGSWAFVIVQNGRTLHEACGRVRKTNSHRMEFQAAIEALTYLKPGTQARLYSDSRILIDSVLKPEPGPQVNQDQIDQLTQLRQLHTIQWQWVKAHFGVKYNERCDQLCIQARENHNP